MIGRYGPHKIAELFEAFQTSLEMDQALQQVYGFDTYDLDSQWRTALGLEPFPSPDELATQLEQEEALPKTVAPAAEAGPETEPAPTP